MVLSHCMAIKQVHSLHERYPFPFLSKTWKARAYMASGRQRRASKAWNSVKEIFLKKNNSEENVSSVPINIYYVCVFSLSIGITILTIKWSTLLTHLWRCLHWKRTASMCIHHNSLQESPGTSVWDRHRSCTVPHLLQHWHTRLRRFVQVNWLI